MRKREKLANLLLRPINPTLVIVLGIYTTLWGTWLVLPWDTFSSASLYSFMAALMPEWVWGAIAICAGLVIIIGAIKPNIRNIQNGAGIAHIHWLVIAIFYFIGDWHNTGGITSLTFATYAALVWLNLKVNRRYLQRKHEPKHYGKK